MSNRDTRRAKPWDHKEPDIREAKRRVSGWIKDHSDPFYRIAPDQQQDNANAEDSFMTKEESTAEAHSRLLRALHEWNNCGGSLDEVVDAIRQMADARTLPDEPSAPLTCTCGEVKVWAYTTKIETATTIHRTEGKPCYQREFATPGANPAGEDSAWQSAESSRPPELRPAEKSGAKVERVTVCCSQCTAIVSLSQKDGRIDIGELGNWYFSTETGWRCPPHAPGQRT